MTDEPPSYGAEPTYSHAAPPPQMSARRPMASGEWQTLIGLILIAFGIFCAVTAKRTYGAGGVAIASFLLGSPLIFWAAKLRMALGQAGAAYDASMRTGIPPYAPPRRRLPRFVRGLLIMLLIGMIAAILGQFVPVSHLQQIRDDCEVELGTGDSERIDQCAKTRMAREHIRSETAPQGKGSNEL